MGLEGAELRHPVVCQNTSQSKMAARVTIVDDAVDADEIHMEEEASAYALLQEERDAVREAEEEYREQQREAARAAKAAVKAMPKQQKQQDLDSLLRKAKVPVHSFRSIHWRYATGLRC